MGEYIAGYIYTFCYIWLLGMFINIFVSKPVKGKKTIEWCGMLGLSLAEFLVSVYLDRYIAWKQIAVILMGGIVMSLLYQIRLLRGLRYVIFYQGVCICTDFMLWMLRKQIFSGSPYDGAAAGMLMGSLSQMLVFCLIIVLQKKFTIDRSRTLREADWRKVLTFPFFSIAVLVVMLVNFTQLNDGREIAALVFLGFGLLMLNFFAYYLLWGETEQERRLNQQQQELDSAKNEAKLYQQMAQDYTLQKKRAHEYKNEMMILESLLQDNRLDTMHILLGKYNQQIKQDAKVIYTNQVVVDAVLNTKYQEAVSKGILFLPKVNDLSGLWLEEQDIVTILANLLNNAIEACEKVERGRRIIKSKMVLQDGNIIFTVENTYQHPLHYHEDVYQTTKKEEGHGYGIENIKEVVNKYDGTCVITHDEEWFRFVIYI